MGRRKLEQLNPSEESYITVTVGGPRLVYRNRRVKRLFGRSSPLRYEPVKSVWYAQLIEESRLARLKKGLSQAAVAKFLSTNQSEISKFEQGKNNPTAEFIERIVSVLKINIKIESD